MREIAHLGVGVWFIGGLVALGGLGVWLDWRFPQYVELELREGGFRARGRKGEGVGATAVVVPRASVGDCGDVGKRGERGIALGQLDGPKMGLLVGRLA